MTKTSYLRCCLCEYNTAPGVYSLQTEIFGTTSHNYSSLRNRSHIILDLEPQGKQASQEEDYSIMEYSVEWQVLPQASSKSHKVDRLC